MSSAGATPRGRREADYQVLVGTGCPAALVELGFLSNGREAANLAKQDYRDQLADGVASGVMDYLQNR
jgi:N-acetylmuramoyl-L-alanine amidase